MDTKKYQVEIEVDIVPTYHDTVPEIIFGIDHAEDRMHLVRPTTVRFDQLLKAGTHSVIVDFVNKADSDCVPDQGLDKYITIGDIRINRICVPRFRWLATYQPQYPEPWYSQQTPPPPPVQTGQTHLGWNGRWQLQFDAPVFGWIHHVENMGWVWPV